MMSHMPLLSILIWLPIVGGLLVAFSERGEYSRAAKWVAVIISLVLLGFCIPLYQGFDPLTYKMQFVESHRWFDFASFKVRYGLGVDGISLILILLTCFTNLIVILAAWNSVRYKVTHYMAIFLILTGITNGVFAATDSILFYVFFEAMLIPMFLGIGVWGASRRSYAAIKFFLYTFLGSVFMLVAFIYLGYQAGGDFSIAGFTLLKIPANVQDLLFLAFLAGFAVKVPMWPVHTWLPDAHTEAPAGGSVILAALMLKVGVYGFIRFSLPIVPGVHEAFDWLLIGLSLMAIVYVGFASLAQKDMKRLIAYSSVSHMGFSTLGIFMAFMIIGVTGDRADAVLGVQGAVFLMFSHAFVSGALFIGVGYMYDRMHTRMIKDFGGVTAVMPVFAAFYLLFAMANAGLPGTSGFVGEFLVILAAFKAHVWIAALSAITLVVGAAYTLWMYKRVFFGAIVNAKLKDLKDINGLELLIFVLLAVPVVLFGVYPQAVLHLTEVTVQHFVDVVMISLHKGSYQ
ncbi:NADH:ubiquinone oxidoreductase subunit M [Piscirickettsia salmonis]|nr:NADH:ubiquinone oxidoreductase subunit M [Piscirickettsia salmonis LF-89 = ATCC VR-1361]ALY03908.1 NADH:ubiquinone oxidoreductase subunit M [Piscirickettsia salmonis]AMA43469.1 NADH:ubiquinone oxidoreductase subunit M [Piscirickettsia salmonis]AOS35938.1 NADH:ubiquinone oxidoreductase subunit M [Piscirickettsia salmonis]APS60642.1 NADH:ubiquinone oxidoreductase subunit M [Piscirickettsia salmonis]